MSYASPPSSRPHEICWAGLNALVAAQAFGAGRIAITDVRQDNLPLAKKLGAQHTLLTPVSMTNEDASHLLKSLFPPEGPDIVIDCAGYESTVQVGGLEFSLYQA